MIVELDSVSNIITEIAEEEISSRFGDLKEGDINTKSGPSDFVTLADRNAEDRLKKALCTLYPAASFIGEEGAAGDPAMLEMLRTESGAFWVVDPLDGTRNFVQGRPEFGTIVALIENGETRAGWIYAIPDKNMLLASKGDGASWRDEPLAPVAMSTKDLFGLRAIGNMIEPWKSQLVPALKAQFETDPVHCSAYGYIRLCRGERDFALYSRCHVWDHAAGILAITEIGGRAEYLDDHTTYAPVPTQGRPLLVAGAPKTFDKVSSILRKNPSEM